MEFFTSFLIPWLHARASYLFATECAAADFTDDLHFAVSFGCSRYRFSSILFDIDPGDGSFGDHPNDDNEEAVVYGDSIQCQWDWSKADNKTLAELIQQNPQIDGIGGNHQLQHIMKG